MIHGNRRGDREARIRGDRECKIYNRFNEGFIQMTEAAVLAQASVLPHADSHRCLLP